MKQAGPVMFSETIWGTSRQAKIKKPSTGSDSLKATNITVLQYFANYKK